MLLLTRKRSEMIQIGDDVVIKIIRTGRRTVKIGIQAPSTTRVLRAELFGTDTPKSLASLIQERRTNRLTAAPAVEPVPCNAGVHDE